ncbi:hypothetical protein LTR95_015786 [Oleoguttula sp. CCFEE 5521]
MAANNPYKELLKQLGIKLSASEAANRTHELRIAEQDALLASQAQLIGQLQGELAKSKDYEKELIKAVQGRDEGIKMLKMQAENEIRRLQGVIREMGKKLESQTSKTVSVGRLSKSGIAPILGNVPAVGPGQHAPKAPAVDRPTVADSTMHDAPPVRSPVVKVAVALQAAQAEPMKRDLIEITDDDEELPIKSEKPVPPAKRKNPSTTPPPSPPTPNASANPSSPASTPPNPSTSN